MDDHDVRWMRRALELAARGIGETNPNPVVGCVIVREGSVVGEGYHRRAGGPHAEVMALRRAGDAARGATAYVNLEPCAHLGRTPPCAPLLVAAGVRRVVAAFRDPNPRVSGRGLKILRRAGIAVTVGVLEGDARRLNERFVRAARMWRPYVLLKAAITLDGRIATARGESKWITRPAQRQEARRLRRLHDGVLVGIGTVLADDPLLLPQPRVRRAFHRIVLDSSLRLPLSSRLVASAPLSPVWVVTGKRGRPQQERLEARGVAVLNVPTIRGRVALPSALRVLRERGLWSLMVEGGSEVLGSFLREELFDEVALFRAPVLLGGRRSVPAFGGPDPLRIGDAVTLKPGPVRKTHEIWYPDR
ncbi:MAG: bifunctional diaminohydroxyphosphoribosylaminopyrimidine deaminase/5-amino-6-(5-phosphoribosylamino)uracil reductase RibD [Vicinamibacteria bacterium]